MLSYRPALLIAFALSAAMLAACTTSPVKPQDATPVPADRMFVAQKPTANDGTVIVVRDTGLLGHGCGLEIYLDDSKVAMIAAGEKAVFPAAAGEHLLTIMPSERGLCKLGRDRQRRSLAFTAKAGDTVNFRLGLSGSGDPIFYQSKL